MDKPTIQASFIKKWLEQTSANETINQAILSIIKSNMGGINNEDLDETQLLQDLLDIASQEGE